MLEFSVSCPALLHNDETRTFHEQQCAKTREIPDTAKKHVRLFGIPGKGLRHPSAFGYYFDISEMSFFSSFEHHEHLHKEFFVRRLSENPVKVEISRPGTVVVGWLHGFHEDWLIHSQVQFLLPFYADTMASLTIPRWLHSFKKQQFT